MGRIHGLAMLYTHIHTHTTLSWYLFNCHSLGAYLKLFINRLWNEIFHFTPYSSLDLPSCTQNYPCSVHRTTHVKYSLSNQKKICNKKKHWCKFSCIWVPLSVINYCDISESFYWAKYFFPFKLKMFIDYIW